MTDLQRHHRTGSGTAVTDFREATAEEIDHAVDAADAVFPTYRATTAEQKAAFLERIAEEILGLGDALIERAHQETALPAARLIGERGRTVGQLRLFASVLREGSWVEARIDTALPDRQPLPRPDLRRMLFPLGPVAVFGASNFPLAFSVAGGDTASALAAGCPVIVKAHPAHPGTSEMAAQAVQAAAEATGMPAGVFSLLHGGRDAGMHLVRHPRLQAVGFTGSLTAGRALFDAAAARPRPIPVYAEMGSINPVFVLPGALAERAEKIATGLAQSVTLGVGQFCTNAGLVAGVRSDAFDAFLRQTADAITRTAPGSMLYDGLCRNYAEGIARLAGTDRVHEEGRSATEADPGKAQAAAMVFSTDAETFLTEETLSDEVFGPSTLIVACQTAEELSAVAQRLDGQLTVTVHGTTEDFARYGDLLSLLETKAGRLIINGFPTGVEVSPAMQHGGPYPATTDSRSTSVGTAAIGRFARPVCYQDFPQSLLPVELRDDNPRGLLRLVDGHWTQDPLR
jgi:alpha-ketoglutaric semialdehyde dehydrogenase